jgi:hypothetical protein
MELDLSSATIAAALTIRLSRWLGWNGWAAATGAGRRVSISRLV